MGDRLNADGGCQRCGLVGCEWANGRGTQHRVADLESARPNPSPPTAADWASVCPRCGGDKNRCCALTGRPAEAQP